MNETSDMFCHYLPPAYVRAAVKHDRGHLNMLVRASAIPLMRDLGARIQALEEFPGYAQVISLASPPVEFVAGSDASPELCRIANDGMAEAVRAHPDRLLGFVAALPMNHMEAAMAEADRALRQLGARGVQLFSHVNGRPLSDPAFRPIFTLMAERDLPIWLHPARGMDRADYATERVSKFELWWALGWPYETSAAMLRLVFAGIFDTWPSLKIITHHVGGMIPMLEGRLRSGMGPELLGTRTPPDEAEAVQTTLREPVVEAVRRFYADTASFGSAAAIECGRRFFGTERLVFASDAPFDPEGGTGYIRATLHALNELELDSTQKAQILAGNARRLMRMG